MLCELCHSLPATIRRSIYTREGLALCGHCSIAVDNNKRKPYSQVMDRVAKAEAGYYIHRKRARLY